ncbi:MAG: hypothetical protein Q7T25_13125 [Sideroxyarcus sp.]|nr:hypothetical protein [Sideroxyarcus sp.]
MAKGICGMDKDWQAESDLRTLVEAEEIRGDPKRLAAAKACAKDKLVDMAKVAALPGDKD